MTKRFPSKVDPWLFVLLVVIVSGLFLLLVTALITDMEMPARIVLALASLFGIGVIVPTLVRTHYTVGDDKLKIVSGPFRWTIALSDITHAEETRSPLSSPALSLDRIRVTYGKNRHIMVSPDDKTGFLRAIGQAK